MTEEEHHARAMLMGMKYIPQYGYYRKLDVLQQRFTRVDALTLEPVSREETIERQNRMPRKAIWYD